ncbi:MAG: RNA polymerase sigma factor [Azonexus sp.]|nr:RNA polymerase sigma factor [Azonexus sp.]
MHDDLSDERLMLAYRDGDTAAFEALYGRYRSRLYRHLAHQCGDTRLAEEFYQDVWLKVINARADYEPLAKFSTWLYRIAHHRLIDHYRQHARNVADLFDGSIDPDELPAADNFNPARQFERSDVAGRLARALDDLPAPQREAFLLAEEGGMSLEEIAAATATGRETVKSRLRYAVGKLRHALQDLL